MCHSFILELGNLDLEQRYQSKTVLPTTRHFTYPKCNQIISTSEHRRVSPVHLPSTYANLAHLLLSIFYRIGSGTGLFTRSLLAHPDWSSSVNQLKAVEPSEGMRDKFAGTIQDERVTVADGTFDDTHIEDGWADVIIIAQVCWSCAYTAIAYRGRQTYILGVIGVPLVS